MAFGKFGRYQPGGVEVRIEWIDLVDLLRTDIDWLESEQGASGRLRLYTSLDSCRVESDREHVRYITVNLLQNALKYSAADSVVVASLAQVGSEVRLRVADRGIGIPRDEVNLLFSPFYRASNAVSHPGTGMGLAIVKRSAKLVGARLEVETDEGRGTTFTVWFPRRAQSGA